MAGLVEAGKVVLPQGAGWVSEFLDELSAFPNAVHDDRVDAFVGALTQLAVRPRRRFVPADAEWLEQYEKRQWEGQ